jgi:hypothetical protein
MVAPDASLRSSPWHSTIALSKLFFLTSYCSGVDIGGSDCSTMNRERSRKCERLRKCEILRI